MEALTEIVRANAAVGDLARARELTTDKQRGIVKTCGSVSSQ
ncbi:hypothetical protein ABGB07_38700 [Micromonosporaceae bacterium B7E4]